MTVPQATYRLQLQPSFGFDEAAALAPYLAELGVTHVYTSPILQAAPGSTHGYDVVDHARVNVELGGLGAHARMCAAFGAAGLGQVLDIVPNHMAITTGNAWWDDVLENGPASRWAGCFDVDWEGPESKLRNTVLIPVLGDHYGRVLERQELVLERDDGSFAVRYFDHRFPVSPATFGLPLSLAAADLAASGKGDDDDLEFLAAAFTALPPATATDAVNARNRHRDKEVLKRILARLCRERAEVASILDRAVGRINADADLLDSLLERQNYRLAYWRTAGRELDYRRFFDITSLAALRMEDPQVFADTHALVLSWVATGVIDGLRIDHPDGLRDPEGYLRRLREATSIAGRDAAQAPAGAAPPDSEDPRSGRRRISAGGDAAQAPAGAAPLDSEDPRSGRWRISAGAEQTWIVIEKILEGHETLPAWPVDGTTGYDFLNLVGGLFIDPEGEAPLNTAYSAFTGESTDWPAVARAKKHQVMQEVLAADLNRLTHLFVAVCEASRRYRDFTRHELHEVLVETIAAFGVYRTYVRPGSTVSAIDEAQLAAALGEALARRGDLDPELFGLLGQVLRGELEGPAAASLLLRFQQVTGPVMAKAIEDTAFYSFNRLVGLNEVGGDPSRFGVGIDELHRSLSTRHRDWPAAMSASSTHDTKRSEDVRARLSLLSEIPDEFAAAARRWAATNEQHRTPTGDASWPDPNLEWLLYQTLVGAWPLSTDRALAYVDKATREAKVHTSWTDPDPAYDSAVVRFVEGVLGDDAFRSAVDAFVAPLVEPGRVTSLAATLIKLTAPGVPDLYQGSERWDLSLVDPDNRRPVDFDGRARQLAALAAASDLGHLDVAADDGSSKLHLIRTALGIRRRHPEAFGAGQAGRYQPLVASGPAASHAVAFLRGGRVATIAPRLVLGLAARGGWADTSLTLPEGGWRDALTGEEVGGGTVALATLLARHPVALLLADREGL